MNVRTGSEQTCLSSSNACISVSCHHTLLLLLSMGIRVISWSNSSLSL